VKAEVATTVCGRYILRQAAAAEREFALERVSWEFASSYNIAPTQRCIQIASGFTEVTNA